jgi:hypothetical protein
MFWTKRSRFPFRLRSHLAHSTIAVPFALGEKRASLSRPAALAVSGRPIDR